MRRSASRGDHTEIAEQLDNYVNLLISATKMLPTEKITGKQIAAARALLGLKQSDLAEAADVSKLTIFKIENSKVKPYVKTMERVRAVLEARGIIFTNGEGVGVRHIPKASPAPDHS